MVGSRARSTKVSVGARDEAQRRALLQIARWTFLREGVENPARITPCEIRNEKLNSPLLFVIVHVHYRWAVNTLLVLTVLQAWHTNTTYKAETYSY